MPSVDHSEIFYRLNDVERDEIKALLGALDPDDICEKWVFTAADKATKNGVFSSLDSHTAHSHTRCCDQVGCSGEGETASLKILRILMKARDRTDESEKKQS